MSDKVKASLPGFASAAVLLVWAIGTATGAFNADQIGTWLIGALSLVGGWLGIAWIPPKLPDQDQ